MALKGGGGPIHLQETEYIQDTNWTEVARIGEREVKPGAAQIPKGQTGASLEAFLNLVIGSSPGGGGRWGLRARLAGGPSAVSRARRGWRRARLAGVRAPAAAAQEARLPPAAARRTGAVAGTAPTTRLPPLPGATTGRREPGASLCPSGRRVLPKSEGENQDGVERGCLGERATGLLARLSTTFTQLGSWRTTQDSFHRVPQSPWSLYQGFAFISFSPGGRSPLEK